MTHGKITGVEPATFECLGRGTRILQIALHHGVAAHEDLADGFAIARGRFEGFRVGDHHSFQGRIAHALASLDRRPLIQRQSVPLGMPGAQSDRAVNLGEAVDVGDVDAHFLHRANHLGGWRGTSDHGLDRVIDGRLGFARHVDQGIEHDRRAAQVGDLLVTDQGENLLRIHTAQEDMHPGQGSNGPWIAPAIAVKHWQRPQIHRVIAHSPCHLVAQRI